MPDDGGVIQPVLFCPGSSLVIPRLELRRGELERSQPHRPVTKAGFQPAPLAPETAALTLKACLLSAMPQRVGCRQPGPARHLQRKHQLTAKSGLALPDIGFPLRELGGCSGECLALTIKLGPLEPGKQGQRAPAH